jgi:hypothetical protein
MSADFVYIKFVGYNSVDSKCRDAYTRYSWN